MSKERNSWSFWAIIIAGIAFLVAWLLRTIFGDTTVDNICDYVIKACSLIAWVLVMVSAWRHTRKGAWKLLLIICFLAILVFGGMMFFGWNPFR